MSERLGRRLRDERRERNESQAVCATRFGISQPGYARWETGGNNPADRHYEAVASFLGCTVDDVWSLIHDEDDQQPVGAEISRRVDNLETEVRLLKRELADLRRQFGKFSKQNVTRAAVGRQSGSREGR